MASSSVLAEQWVGHRKRAGLITGGTARNHRAQLGYFVRAHPSETFHVDRRSIRRWLESIGHLSAGSRRSHVSTVRTFLHWASAEGHVAAKVVDLLPKVRQPRRVPRALNSDQITLLLNSMVDERLLLIVSLMVWTGMRCAEVAALKIEDIDERAGTLLVRGKGGHERMIPIPTELVPVLARWLDGHARVPGPLLPGRIGPLRASTVSAMVARAMVSTGVKVRPRDGRGAHALRHTAASDVLERGAPITLVQQMLGHADIGTTAQYLRVARLEDLRAAMNGRTYGTGDDDLGTALAGE